MRARMRSPTPRAASRSASIEAAMREHENRGALAVRRLQMAGRASRSPSSSRPVISSTVTDGSLPFSCRCLRSPAERAFCRSSPASRRFKRDAGAALDVELTRDLALACVARSLAQKLRGSPRATAEPPRERYGCARCCGRLCHLALSFQQQLLAFASAFSVDFARSSLLGFGRGLLGGPCAWAGRCHSSSFVAAAGLRLARLAACGSLRRVRASCRRPWRRAPGGGGSPRRC